ncbi:Protein of unknown function [Gryllus bimaculatus]|nr:Protein of unknown function [Gryllus bimaculatus]
MEFDFQKTKAPPFILDELMNSRPRNSTDMRGSSTIVDFLQQPNINQQELIPNPEMETNQFSGLPDFHPIQNSSQISQFMFDQESSHSNDDSFLTSARKDDPDKHPNSKKFCQPMDSFFDSCADSPQNAPSPSNDFQISSRFNQQPFQCHNKALSIDRPNNRQHLQERSVVSNDAPLQNSARDVEHPVSQMRETNVPCQKTTNASAKSESFKNFNAELQEFTESYTKLSTEKAELEKQVSHTEQSLKEYREQALNYKNKYEEVQEKLNEEIKNRESILAQVEYVNGVSQLLDKYFKDICNTLKLYGDINCEYKERNAKLHEQVEKQVKEYENVISSYKDAIEKLKGKILKLEKQNNETTIEFSKIKEELAQQLEDVNSKLCGEQSKSTSLEKNLFALEQTNKELISRLEQSEINFSERYSSLQKKLEEANNNLEAIRSDNLELKIYEVKFKQLETFNEKLQQEKEALSTIVNTSQNNLLKSEIERSEHLKSIEKLLDERETINKEISELKEQCTDVNLKLVEVKTNYEQLFNENELLKKKNENILENLESLKVSKLQLEEEIKQANWQDASSRNVIQTMTDELNGLRKELEVAKVEKLSSLEAEKEELKLIEKELREEVAEKDVKILDLVTLNSSLEVDMHKQDEMNKKIQEELSKTKSDMASTRQEMLVSVDQYREQFMSELKENEDCRKELQSKYETACSEMEKIIENKKQSDTEILNLQQSIKFYENKINTMDGETKKMKLEQEKKENDFNEKISKLKILVSQLEEEKVLLEKSIHDMKGDINLKQMLQEENISLEKKIKIIQQENEELKEKLKSKEKSSTTTFSETETLKEKYLFLENECALKKNLCQMLQALIFQSSLMIKQKIAECKEA